MDLHEGGGGVLEMATVKHLSHPLQLGKTEYGEGLYSAKALYLELGENGISS